MSMKFKSDASGLFGVVSINGVPQIEVHNDGTIRSPSGGIIGTSEGILGIVSQVGGIPTGAIMEHNSNANGEYWKFAGGLMICATSITVTTGLSMVSYGGLYELATNAVWDFPAEFITSIGLIVGGSSTDSNAKSMLAASGIGATTVNLNCVTKSASPTQLTLRAQAIGRWY